MTRDETKYLELFLHLEAYCNQRFQCQSGVRTYISALENNAWNVQQHVPSWKDTFYLLKHLNWVRNQITHPNDGYNTDIDEDIDNLQSFLRDIDNQDDPISKACRIEEEARKKAEEAQRRAEEAARRAEEARQRAALARMMPNASGGNEVDTKFGKGILLGIGIGVAGTLLTILFFRLLLTLYQ